MDRRQASIIVSLSVLIVFVGYLANRVNDGMYEMGTNGSLAVIDSVGNDEISSLWGVEGDDFFETAQLSRDTQAVTTLQSLETIINDENVPESEKKSASEEYTNVVMRIDNESRIETQLKAQGYEDALCFIEGGEVTVYVKATEELSDENYAEIRSIVAAQANLYEVKIQARN